MQVIAKVAKVQMNVITNPMVNLHIQGRNDPQPVRRGITRVKELLAAGGNVTCGSDDISNIFFSFGRMDMLEVAIITSLAAHMTRPDEIQTAFEMPRKRSAQALRLGKYGIEVSKPADLVFLRADNAQEALRLQPIQRVVIRDGKLVAQRWEELRFAM